MHCSNARHRKSVSSRVTPDGRRASCEGSLSAAIGWSSTPTLIQCSGRTLPNCGRTWCGGRAPFAPMPGPPVSLVPGLLLQTDELHDARQLRIFLRYQHAEFLRGHECGTHPEPPARLDEVGAFRGFPDRRL